MGHSKPAQSTITCSKLATEILEEGVWPPSGFFIINFEHIPHLALVLLLLALSR